LFLLLASSVFGNNYFMIDTHLKTNVGWTKLKYSGSSCKICVKNGLDTRTECKTGPSDSTEYWHVFFQQQLYVTKNTYMWTSCSDALLIDYAQIRTTHHLKQWGMPENQAWCLSTDPNDAGGDWTKYIAAGQCFRTLRFNAANNNAAGWTTWHPLRRSLEAGLPTDAEVDACEKNTEDCDLTDLVDQILTFEALHPEGFVELITITDEVEPLNRDSSEEGSRRLLKL